MRQAQTTLMARRRVLNALLAFGLAIGLAACGGSGDGIESAGEDVDVTTAKAEGQASGDLTFSNWAFYVDKQTIPDFEQATDISVNYIEEINGMEEFFGKIQPQLERGESGGRDLFMATDWLAKRMYDLGYLQAFDKEALEPALANLNPTLPGPTTDPERRFTLPWSTGMNGIIVDKTKAPDISSVNDLFDPKYKGKVDFFTELRETVPLVMKADGVDMEEATEEDWLAAIDKIGEAAESGQIRRFAGGDLVRDVASGDVIAATFPAGDALQLTVDNPNIEFVMPDEGCVLFSDNLVIPVGAPNPTAAYEFMNYVYEPENQAQITEYINYISPVDGVQEIFEEAGSDLASSQAIFPDEQYTEKCSTSVSPPGGPEAERRVEQAWQNVVTGG